MRIKFYYPNWWGTMPMPVFAFLEQYEFRGKTIMPFCTNEGNGMGSSERDIKKLCPNAVVKKAWRFMAEAWEGRRIPLKNGLRVWSKEAALLGCRALASSGQ